MKIFKILIIVLISANVILTVTGCPSPKPADVETKKTDEQTGSPPGVQVYPDPVLSEERIMGDTDLIRIGSELGVKLKSGTNRFYKVDTSDVQLNHLIAENPDENIGLYYARLNVIGNENTVLLGTEGFYEIITDNPYASDAIRTTLDLAPLQGIKLTPHRLYGEGVITGEKNITGVDLESVSSQLGFKAGYIINQYVTINDVTYRVNLILPEEISINDAYSLMKKSRGTELGLYILDDVLIEVVTDNREMAEKIFYLLNFPPPSLSGIYHYKVRLSVLPVDAFDYMKSGEAGLMASSGSSPTELEKLDPKIIWGETIPLFSANGRTRYVFEPDVEVKMVDDSIAVGTVSISDNISPPLPVNIVMSVETNRAYQTPPSELSAYIGSTEYWPMGTNEVRSALEKAMLKGKKDTVLDIVNDCYDWVRENIKLTEGPDKTRFGVEAVMSQGIGSCWDRSDVFITLVRTAGIPSRQVAGWIYGKGGYVWSQVWLQSDGIWIDVDTTNDYIGVNGFYIPIFGTRDGSMPFIYSELPKIERLGS